MKNILRFPKLKPHQDDYETCNNMMYRIDDLAPYDSHVSAVINLLADGSYHTVIGINALCGKFQSEGKTLSLVSSVKQAHKTMLTVLADWKKNRFNYKS